MYRTLRTVLGSYLYIMVVITPHVIISFFSKTGDILHLNARYWARFSLWCANHPGGGEGQENIPDGPAVYIPNHVSHFDVFAILGYLNVQFRWTLKKELFRIPLLVFDMKRTGYILIDRSNYGNAIQPTEKPIYPDGHDVGSLMEEVYKSIKLSYTL